MGMNFKSFIKVILFVLFLASQSQHQPNILSSPAPPQQNLQQIPQQHQTIQQQAIQQPQIIDAGRTLVQAKPAEPVFLAPPNSIQIKRAMHSEAYVKYVLKFF